MIEPSKVTTTFELPGLRVTRNLGIVRGITVRSRSILGTFGGALQTMVGGNITAFTSLCEKAREEAFELMLSHAAQMGANAVVGMRYDANDVMDGVTEVLAYGTAVLVEPFDDSTVKWSPVLRLTRIAAGRISAERAGPLSERTRIAILATPEI